ncbi:hypothetical protein CUMW_148750 [Citrus unshiu]|uniref:Uncharacterized protein n=1 Tax=Citrus unshiu TaxID=55188 RepID=A0A2H5PLZ6_CITUN|nr:hypothetical protein CUMW_148750 [Citrus unshiu]
MGNQLQLLDYVLVPSGMLIMVTYHLWLLYQTVKHPTKTVISINAINRHFWTLRNNIMGSTLLASTALTLSSLIAVLMTSSSGDQSTWFIFGDRCDLFFSIKFFLTLSTPLNKSNILLWMDY